MLALPPVPDIQNHIYSADRHVTGIILLVGSPDSKETAFNNNNILLT